MERKKRFAIEIPFSSLLFNPNDTRLDCVLVLTGPLLSPKVYSPSCPFGDLHQGMPRNTLRALRDEIFFSKGKKTKLGS